MLRNCIEDGGRPPAAAVQAEAANHPLRLNLKGSVVSEMGKGEAKTSSGVGRRVERK